MRGSGNGSSRGCEVLVRHVVVAASFVLAACSTGGPPARPTTPTPILSVSPSRSSPSQRPGVSVVVRGVTVNLCDPCLRLARRVGVNLPRLVRGDLARITGLLPRMRARVDVVAHRGVGPPAGVGAYTEWSTGHVHIYLHPSTRDPSAAVRTWLPFTLAHELDHAARILRGPGIDDTLLDWFVAEGMADRFADEVFPATPPSAGDHALSAQQTVDLWARARPRLRDIQTIPRLRRWFIGGRGVPRWTGYTIGYDIVSEYLVRHPGATTASLVGMSPRVILRGSGLRP